MRCGKVVPKGSVAVAVAVAGMLSLAFHSSVDAEELYDRRDTLCGQRCIHFVIDYQGGDKTFNDVVSDFQSMKGQRPGLITIKDLVDYLALQKIEARGVRASTVSSLSQSLPCVLHLIPARNADGHFVVLLRCTSQFCEIWDGTLGRKMISVSELAQSWSGYAVVVNRHDLSRNTELQASSRLAGIGCALLCCVVVMVKLVIRKKTSVHRRDAPQDISASM